MYLIIDGNNGLHRIYNAMTMGGEPDPEKTPPAVARSLFLQVRNAMESYRARQAILVWDGSGANDAKRALYPDYKAGRNRSGSTDQVLAWARAEFTHQVEASNMRLAICSVAGHEADDVIATLADALEQVNEAVVIATNDGDLMQLLSPLCSIHQPQKGGVYREMDAATFAREKGHPHTLIPTFKALAGDKSDGIAGVPGVGKGYALAMMEKFGDLDGIYRHIGSVFPAHVRARLIEHRELAYTCLLIATLRRDVPLPAAIRALLPEGAFTYAR